MWAEGKEADAIIESKGIKQITDTVPSRKPSTKSWRRIRAASGLPLGKDKLFGFFVGQVMKATGGKADPAQLNQLLKKKLAG